MIDRAAAFVVLAGLAGCGGAGRPAPAPAPPAPAPGVPLVDLTALAPDADADADADAAPVDLATSLGNHRVVLAPVAVSWPTDRRLAQFHAIGGGSGWSTAIAVSADGSTPVGMARATGGFEEAVRWRDGTMSPLGTLDLAGDDRSTAWAVSRDGDTVVGESTATETSSVPVVWRGAAAPAALTLPPGVDSGQAHAVSRDGTIIAGCGTGNCDLALRWRDDVPAIVDTERPFRLAAHSMSEDGAAIAGTVGDQPGEAIRVTTRAVDRRGPGSVVEAISDDGTIMVGNLGPKPVLWRGKAVTELGLLPGYDACYARAVAADGGRVVGNCTRASTWTPRASDDRTPPPADPHASVAFVWDRRTGMRSVADALAAAKVVLPASWWLDEAFDICGYGVTIVGNGRSPSTASEAWMVILPR